MDKQDWYYRQRVTQAQMDSAFDRAESADQAQNTDSGFVGINSGLAVVAAGGMNATVQAGVAYDPDGQRIAIGSDQPLDLSAYSVALVGNEKYLSVFAVFARDAQTVAVDGNGISLFYDQLESFTIEVEEGAEATAGTAATITAANVGTTYALSDGMTLDISTGEAGVQTATFNTADFADIANATRTEVLLVINGDIGGVSATDTGAAIQIDTIATGDGAKIMVAGGSAAAIAAARII